MKVVPLNDNVLIKRDVVEEKKSPGGVILPKGNQKAPVFCTVMSTGPEVIHKISPGARVVVSTYAGVDLELDEEKYVMVKAEDVLGIVTETVKTKPPKKAKPKPKPMKKAAK